MLDIREFPPQTKGLGAKLKLSTTNQSRTSQLVQMPERGKKCLQAECKTDQLYGYNKLSLTEQHFKELMSLLL